MKIILLLGSLASLPVMVLHLLFPVSCPVTSEPQQAVTSLLLLAASVGLSYAASLFLTPEEQEPEPDERPTTLSKRGSFINWHLGVRRLGPVFGWAGNRSSIKEGKTGKGRPPQTRIYTESGWHILCVGPCEALHGIFQNGERIFSGPITKDSHPSGTSVSLGKEGVFKVYWGEVDQPVPGSPLNLISSSVGDYAESRWPYVCHIVWVWKRLGQSAIWPALEYVVERRQTNSVLEDTEGWVDPSLVIDDTEYDIEDHNNGIEGTGWLEVKTTNYDLFGPGRYFQLDGNSMTGGIYEIRNVSVRFEIALMGFYFDTYIRIYPVGGVTGANDNGKIQGYELGTDTAIRPAHAMAEILFASWPLGLGLDQDDWDIDALEEFGVLTDDGSGGEDLWTSWLATRGKTAKDLLAEGMQDLGLMLPQDTDNGKVTFKAVRKPDSVDATVPQDMLLDPLPEREVALLANRPDLLVFQFSDRDLNWKKMTISIADDGHASYAEFAQSKNISLMIINHFNLATQVAERRSQEMLSGGSAFTVHANRWARALMPGDVISVYGFEEVLRILSVQFDGDTGKVTLKCIPDYFDVVASDFQPDQIAPFVTTEPAEVDLFRSIEVPRKLLGGSTNISIAVPRIRAHNQMDEAMVHVSEDNVTYDIQAKQIESHNGGVLLDAIAADDDYIIDEGPTFTAFGPDIADVLDLSASESLWRTGRQLCCINEEIFFLKKVTAIAGTTYRLDGLIRARYDTRKAAHAADDRAFIVPNDELLMMTNSIFVPNQTIYTKSQPSGVGGTIPIGAIAPYQFTLYGKGIRPEPVENLRVTAPFKGVAAYTTGEDISFQWSWYSIYGAGHRPSGEPQPDYEPEGEFYVRITTDAGTVKRELNTTDLTYVYSNVNLVADFGSEPASFKIVVSWLKDGWESSDTELTVEKVS